MKGIKHSIYKHCALTLMYAIMLSVPLFCVLFVPIIALISYYATKQRRYYAVLYFVLYLALAAFSGDILHYINAALIVALTASMFALEKNLFLGSAVSGLSAAIVMFSSLLIMSAVFSTTPARAVGKYVESAKDSLGISFLAQSAYAEYVGSIKPDEQQIDVPSDPQLYLDAAIEYAAAQARRIASEQSVYIILHLSLLFALFARCAVFVRGGGRLYDYELPASYATSAALPVFILSAIAFAAGGEIKALSAAVFHAIITIPNAAAALFFLYYCLMLTKKPRLAFAAFAVLCALAVAFPFFMLILAALGFINLFVRLRKIISLL